MKIKSKIYYFDPTFTVIDAVLKATQKSMESYQTIKPIIAVYVRTERLALKDDCGEAVMTNDMVGVDERDMEV